MDSSAQEVKQVLNIPIEDIIPNRFQPRLSFDEEGLKELANSIKEHGIIQPLVVRKLAEKYEIIAGERRYKAAKLAGLTQVPAIVTNMDDQRSAEAAIVENVQRRDLSAIEEAKSYQALLDKDNITQEQLARKMGLSQSAISNKLRLLTLSEAVQNALIDGRISERHARSLLQIEDKYEQEEWLNKIIDERLTVRELDKQIKSKSDKIKSDVPLVDSSPNLDLIRETATDIVSPNVGKSEEIPVMQNEQPKKMPNKFFNFLEDESVSMNMNESAEEQEDDNFSNIPIINYEREEEKEKASENIPLEENNSEEETEIPIVEPETPSDEKEIKEIKPVDSTVESTDDTSNKEEEIELLDFEAPQKVDYSSKTEQLDALFNEFAEKLKENDFEIKKTKSESIGIISYKIDIYM